MSELPHNVIAMIGSYVPRRCGIATFSHDLATAITEHVFQRPLSQVRDVVMIAMDDQAESYDYGPEVVVRINQHRREDYRNAAEVINNSKVNVVSLQHEYGLFGGDHGDYLFELLDRLEVPLVPTLHTILTQPSSRQLEVLRRICKQSSYVVVMADKARQILRDVYDVQEGKIRLIHHGVPDVPLGDTEPFKTRFNLSGRPTILTFGLLSPGKSIEVVLDALAKVVPDHPDLAYVVLGVTHPGVKRESGESYRISLERRAVELGIEKNVAFHNRYVSLEDLREYLQAADVYTTPYRGKEQITSGTLAYAVASGKPVVSTPYWHAEELLADGRGCLVEFGDVDGFAEAIRGLLGDIEKRERMRKAAYEYGREMIWPNVAHSYGEVYEEARRTFTETRAVASTGLKSLIRMSLPEVNLKHLRTMTDDTGMLQHSVYATPDRRHGYCSDDNARALIVVGMAWSLFQDQNVLPLMRIYLSFLHFAQVEGTGRFRNFMSYDRRWLEEDGSDDCQGRVLWALGHLIAHAPDPSAKELAESLFKRTVRNVETIQSLRSQAFAILGLHYYLREHAEDAATRAVLVKLAGRLNSSVSRSESSDWPWPEEIVTYDNGRLPQALIIAGYVLGDQAMVDHGLNLLRWLLEIQAGSNGSLSLIGNDGWYKRGGERALYDQQPLEAAALIGACKAAYRASEDAHWLAEMRRCFEWYLGRNEPGITLIDFKTRGCFDGLQAEGVNRNQGAESLLSWLLSLLIMHEMQTGDVPNVG